jgi:hypothetical protein
MVPISALSDRQIGFRSPIPDPMIHSDRKFPGVIQNGNTVTMDEWVADYAPADGDLLPQMDIEGAEYPVLLNASEKVSRRVSNHHRRIALSGSAH